MSNDNVVSLEKTASLDGLTDILREGARRLLEQAIEAEVAELLEQYADLKTAEGRQAVVRNGYLPSRTIQTGLGDVPVKVPKVRDRSKQGIKFNSKLVPPYLKRTKSVEEFLPWLYLKGVSTGDFQEALQALLGPDAPGLSANSISRLKSAWEQEYEVWSKRELAGKRYVYAWVDGIYSNVRLDDRQCMLVIIGSDEQGRKELIAVNDGYRESESSWAEVLIDLRQRGLEHAPKLAIGDGALGFWKAAAKHWSQTRQQRCWVHKTANVLEKLPKSMQPKVKAALHEIYGAETKAEAEKAFDNCVARFSAKYPKAMECLEKDRDRLLTFYDFPAEHWIHIRTTNPIESVFATVRLRTDKTKNCGSRKTTLMMVFKLVQSAQKKWRRLRGYERLAEVIEGVQFKDGIRQPVEQQQEAA